jgi:hypothetical protein
VCRQAGYSCPVRYREHHRPARTSQREEPSSGRYYLKLFPASFIKSAGDGREQHTLHLDMYSDPEKMFANGWKEFSTLEPISVGLKRATQ